MCHGESILSEATTNGDGQHSYALACSTVPCYRIVVVYEVVTSTVGEEIFVWEELQTGTTGHAHNA